MSEARTTSGASVAAKPATEKPVEAKPAGSSAEKAAPDVFETAPQPRDSFGRLLDQWGLPENGPCRAEALAKLGKPDPREDPDGWKNAAAPAPIPFAAPESGDA